MLIEPEKTVFGIKRLLGRRINDKQAKQEDRLETFKIVYKERRPFIEINHGIGIKLYSPEQIAAIILKELKKRAETNLGEKLQHAVFVTPANFDCTQNRALLEAAKLAGFEVKSLIPVTAAALIWNKWRSSTQRRFHFVLNVGGDTIDVAMIYEEPRNSVRKYMSHSLKGSSSIGLIDFDRRIMDKYMSFYEEKTGMKLHEDKELLLQLRVAARKARKALSTIKETTIRVGLVPMRLTRTEFEEMNADIFEFIEKSIWSLCPRRYFMRKSKLCSAYIGGEEHIPRINKLVSQQFIIEPEKVFDVASEEFVSGAAVVAATFSLKERHRMPFIDIVTDGRCDPLACLLRVWNGEADPFGPIDERCYDIDFEPIVQPRIEL